MGRRSGVLGKMEASGVRSAAAVATDGRQRSRGDAAAQVPARGGGGGGGDYAEGIFALPSLPTPAQFPPRPTGARPS